MQGLLNHIPVIGYTYVRMYMCLHTAAKGNEWNLIIKCDSSGTHPLPPFSTSFQTEDLLIVQMELCRRGRSRSSLSSWGKNYDCHGNIPQKHLTNTFASCSLVWVVAIYVNLTPTYICTTHLVITLLLHGMHKGKTWLRSTGGTWLHRHSTMIKVVNCLC